VGREYEENVETDRSTKRCTTNKKCFNSVLADITLFIYTVKGKGYPSTGHEA